MPRVLSRAVRKLIQAEALEPREILDVSIDPPYTTWTHRFVSDNKAITFADVTYTPLGFSRGPFESESDEAVDRITIQLDDVSRTWARLVQGTLIQGSRIRLRKIFKGYQTTERDAITVFDGFIGAPSFDDFSFSVEIRSVVAYIETELPPRDFQPGCSWFLGSSGCGVDMTSTQNTLPMKGGPGTTRSRLRGPELAGFQTRHWEAGYVRVLDGPEKNQVRPILNSTPEEITLVVPFTYSLLNVDLQVVRGCRKTKADCQTRYANKDNFGGFSEVPKTPIIDE